MARLLADEQFDIRVVDILRRRHGHDVATVRQACDSKYGDGFDDKIVIEYAHADRRIVLTDNRRHFWKLHLEMPWHSGIVLCQVYSDPNAKAERINAIIRETYADRGIPLFTGLVVKIPSEESTTP